MLQDSERELGGKRYGEEKLRAVADSALPPQPAAVGFDDVLGDRQTKPCAAGLARTRGIDAVETLEDPLLVGKRNTHACVAHGDHGLARTRSRADADTAALRRIMHRIVRRVRA